MEARDSYSCFILPNLCYMILKLSVVFVLYQFCFFQDCQDDVFFDARSIAAWQNVF